MKFPFAMSSIKHTFFCIIGLCEIKVPLIKLKNFTQSFYAAPLTKLNTAICVRVQCRDSESRFHCNTNARMKWEQRSDANLFQIGKLRSLSSVRISNEYTSRVLAQLPLLIDTHADVDDDIYCFHSISVEEMYKSNGTYHLLAVFIDIACESFF